MNPLCTYGYRNNKSWFVHRETPVFSNFQKTPWNFISINLGGQMLSDSYPLNMCTYVLSYSIYTSIYIRLSGHKVPFSTHHTRIGYAGYGPDIGQIVFVCDVLQEVGDFITQLRSVVSSGYSGFLHQKTDFMIISPP